LVRRLHLLTTESTARFVCVTGASGSGKSSLVHAGVAPQLRGHRWHVFPALVPAGEPLGRLVSLVAAPAGGQRQSLLRELWVRGDSLARIIAAWRAKTGNRYGRVLLVLDQLEELVTLSGPAERKLFLDQIAAALVADRRLWVLATLRIEFLADLLAGEHAELFAAPVAVGTMRPAEMVTIIEQPARLAGMSFESGMVAEILEETGTPDALPLLAYLLQEMYLAMGPGRVATRQTYQALGGVAGALARQADAVFAELRVQYEPELILSTLLRFVTMDGPEPTRRRLPVSELSAEQWAADWVRSGRSPDYLLTGDPVTCLAWLPDGDRVVTGSVDATARVWSAEVDLDALTRAARARVFRGADPGRTPRPPAAGRRVATGPAPPGGSPHRPETPLDRPLTVPAVARPSRRRWPPRTTAPRRRRSPKCARCGPDPPTSRAP
jgi:hypothetical protein